MLGKTWYVSILAAAFIIFSGCAPAGTGGQNSGSSGDGQENGPRLIVKFDPVALPPGETAEIADLSSHFISPSGQTLQFEVRAFSPLTAVISGDTLLLTSPAEFNGTVSGLIIALDLDGRVENALIKVTVASEVPVNRSPMVVSPFSPVSGQEDGQAAASLSGHFSDPDDDALTYEAMFFFTINASVSGGQAVFSAPANWNGSEEGSIRACDTQGACVSTSILVTFNPVNDAPAASGSFSPVSLEQGKTATVFLTGRFIDVDADMLTYGVSGFASVGATVAGGRLEITGPADWTGTETGSISACDPFGACASSPLSVTVTPGPATNHAPVVSTPFAPAAAAEDGQATAALTGHFSDPDGDALGFTVSGFTSITAAISGTQIVFTAPPNWNGAETGSVKACDPALLCVSTSIQVTFISVNDAPTAVKSFVPVTLDQGQTLSVPDVAGYFTDVDGNPLTYSLIGFANVGAVLTQDRIDLTAPASWAGTENGSVKACDPGGLCVSSTLAVTVRPPVAVNHAPVVSTVFAPVTVAEDGLASAVVVSHFSDPDNDTLTYIATGFTSIVAAIVGTEVRFSAPPNWNGGETGTIHACDPAPLCVSTPIQVTFTPVNDAPTAVKAFAPVSLAQGTTVSVPQVATYFTDVDGGALTYSVTGFTSVGAVISQGRVLLTAPAAFSGTETGAVRACDAAAACVSSPLAVTVTAPSVLPLVVLAYNDLGMNLINDDYAYLMIRPPGNDFEATIIDPNGPLPVIVQSGVTVEYAIAGNTRSDNKTNFWTYLPNLLGFNLPLNIGLSGLGLTGIMTPTVIGDYRAAGVPVTPTLDNGTHDAYPLAQVRVIKNGVEVGTSQNVMGVSWEIRCNGCHAENPTWEYDVLKKHDSKIGTSLQSQRPIACGKCHPQGPNGSFMPGLSGFPPLSQALHKSHANRMGNKFNPTCNGCHPGVTDKMERSIHATMGLTCTTCHGTMTALAASTRKPWIDEPRCSSCHVRADFEFEQPGALFKDSIGHNGVPCQACHGSPHAMTPSTLNRDNLQSIAAQGYAGPIGDCTLCHSVTPAGAFSHSP